MTGAPSGTYVETSTAGEVVRAFIPHPLPPELELTMGDYDLMERANRSLGRLDGLSAVLPDPALFIYLYVRKEALLSSQVEGTQSSLSDLLAHEMDSVPGVPLDDVLEVSAYVRAMEHGLRRLGEGFPLSLRLVREIHEVLLEGGRGEHKNPGEFRRSQNWIGGTRPGNAAFVPPPPERLLECLGAWEKFLHDDPQKMPLLIKAGLAHAQFETIHPFLDGNGRVGRLLITLLLCSEGALTAPTLYLSLHFKEHREQYYDRLQDVRNEGAWTDWIRFFLEGVLAVSDQAVDACKRTLALFERDRGSIQALGRPAGSALRVHDAMKRHPMLSIQRAAEITGLSVPTVGTAMANLKKLDVVSEVTGRRRDRLFTYERYVALLSEGTEPLAR